MDINVEEENIEPQNSTEKKHKGRETEKHTTTPSQRIISGQVLQPLSKCRWIIPNFLHLCTQNLETLIFSPIFSTGYNSEFKWNMALKIYDSNIDFKPFIGLHLISLNSVKVLTNFKISLIIDNIVIIEKKCENCMFESQRETSSAHGSGFQKFITLITVTEKLFESMDPKLVFECEVEGTLSTDAINVYRSNLTLNRISDDYESLLMSGNYSDVTIISEEKEYQAHKAILANQSEIFAAFFKNNIKNDKRCTLRIGNVKPDILYEILRFMYSGKVTNLEVLAIDLITTAKVYAIRGLEKVCFDYICNNINIDNAIRILEIAIVYKFYSLKEHVINFIAKHTEEIISKPEFTKIQCLDSSIVTKIFHNAVALKKYNFLMLQTC